MRKQSLFTYPNNVHKELNKVTKKLYYKKLNQYLSEMPTKFWGIEIPKEYILTSNGNSKNKPQDFHRPLLLQYWRDIVEGN